MLKIVHMKVNGKDVELAVDERESHIPNPFLFPYYNTLFIENVKI